MQAHDTGLERLRWEGRPVGEKPARAQTRFQRLGGCVEPRYTPR